MPRVPKSIHGKPAPGSYAQWLNRRVDFLKQHPELWDSPKKEIVKALKKVGLLSPTTSACDVNVKMYVSLAFDRAWTEKRLAELERNRA